MRSFAAAALLASAALGSASASASALADPILEQAIVDAVNADESQTWTAEMSPRFTGVDKYEAYRMLGVTELLDGEDTKGGVITWAPRPHLVNQDIKIPAAFDARDWWDGDPEKGGANCSTIRTVENQGGCGSCWAFGSSEAFSDRTCIASQGKIDVIMSPQEPTSCVGCMVKGGGLNTSCGYNGCGGGSPHQAWEFFAADGLVDVNCWPYASGNTSIYINPKNNKTEGPDLKCNQSIAVDKTCVNGDPWKPHFALNSSIVGLKNNTDIQRELLEHGPVTAAFKVFEDFFHYKSGVYNGCSPPANQSRKIAGYHAVKIVGWGTTDIDPTLSYWTVQNSWGPTWGEDGYFKMVWDFTDEFNVTHSSCGVGKGVVAGLPDLSKYL